MKAKLLPLSAALAVLFAAPLRAETPAPDSLLPPPHTWAIGFHGFGPIFNPGAPSVRYVLNERWAFELTQSFSYNHGHTGTSTTSTTWDERTSFDVLRTLATYQGFKLSALIEPALEHSYSRSDFQPAFYSRSETNTLNLNTGVELEYFLRRDFSVAARAVYAFNWAHGLTSNPVASIPNSHSAQMAVDGESFALHYYFEGPSADAPVSSAGPGAWAIGWAGIGPLYASDYQPSLKYVWSDKTAFEIIPMASWTHRNSGNTYSHSQSITVPFDIERKVMTRGPIVLSAVLEPFVGSSYAETNSPPFSNSHTKTWNYGLGAGAELEYFLRPNISFGARALLLYTSSYQSNYSQLGYGGQGVFQNVFLGGQVLNAHWYFGGKGGGS